jgi:hypothetical protein
MSGIGNPSRNTLRPDVARVSSVIPDTASGTPLVPSGTVTFRRSSTAVTSIVVRFAVTGMLIRSSLLARGNSGE